MQARMKAEAVPEIEWLDVRASDGPTSKLLLARSSAPRAPLVLIVPALGMEAGYYDRFAKQLAQGGVHAAAMELRGNGTSNLRASHEVDFGYGDFLTYDLPAAIRVAREAVPGAPLYLLGHSLGGQLATAYAGLRREADLQGLIFVASGTPYYRTWGFPGRPILWIVARLFPWIADRVGHFPGRRIGFATREARTVMRDWATLIRDGVFRLRNWEGPDLEEGIAEVELPILSITLEKDVFVPKHAAEHMLAKMPRARVERWHWDPEAEGLPRTHHVRWPRRAEPVVERIVNWLGARPTPGATASSGGLLS